MIMGEEQTENEQGGAACQQVHPKAHGQSDGGRRPQGASGRQTSDAIVLAKDGACPKEAHAAYHLSRNARRIAATHMLRNKGKGARPQAYRCVGAYAGFAPMRFTLPPDETARDRCKQCTHDK
jgi:hypothetical protein